MSVRSIKIAPPYSIILISDPLGGDVPQNMSRSIVAATTTCVAVGCKLEIDGPTEIVLGSNDEVGLADSAAFDGEIECPNRSIVVTTAEGTVLLKSAVSSAKPRVRVWVSDEREPNLITIAV